MESYLYKCQYCGKDYKPNRRKKQKYCSNSCRTRSFVIRNNKGLGLVKKNVKEQEPAKIDKMSLAGVGNAAVGTLAVQIATNLLTSSDNKPATKGDIKNLLHEITQRYYPILNLSLRQDGAKAFYDIETQTLIYKKTT